MKFRLNKVIGTFYMKRFSAILNLALLLLLGLIAWRERYLPRLWQKFFPDNSLAHYQARPAYQDQLARYTVYGKKGGIVMLGTSLTQDIDWNELLNRGDMINRGYGGDIMAVLASRIPLVVAVAPKTCIIEGGINDIDTGVPIDSALQTLQGMVDSLQRHNILPIVTAVTHVTEKAHRQRQRNELIKQYNTGLYQLAKQKGLAVVDNNPVMAPDGYLKAELAKHGLHFRPAAYLLWKGNIEKILAQLAP
jgi:lysophospholipase L1-like esterase